MADNYPESTDQPKRPLNTSSVAENPNQPMDAREAAREEKDAAELMEFEHERHRYDQLHRRRHLLLPKALKVGFLAGAIAVAFHVCLDLGEANRTRLIGLAHHWGWLGAILFTAFTAASVIVAAFLVKYFAPEAGGSGIPHVKAVLQGYRKFRWLRVLAVKFFGGLIGISGGLALGREGPTVQMGAALGAGCATLPHTRGYEPRVLIAAGGGAGLTAAFNSPLSGIVFVLEELQGQLASLEFFAAAIACLTADMVCRAVLGQFPVFHVYLPDSPDLNLLLAFIPLGMLSGFLGVVFNQSLLACQKLGALPGRYKLLWWLACGLALGVTGWFSPELLGGGQRFLDRILDNGHGLGASLITLFFAIRFSLTIASYSTGAAGGIFSPILVLGALLGLLFENTTQMLFPHLRLEPNTFAVVGMAAFFTAVVRAPLTGIVLMIEMTGNYALILPLFAASFSALMVADVLYDVPIYEALLERDLQKQRENSIEHQPSR